MRAERGKKEKREHKKKDYIRSVQKENNGAGKKGNKKGGG